MSGFDATPLPIMGVPGSGTVASVLRDAQNDSGVTQFFVHVPPFNEAMTEPDRGAYSSRPWNLRVVVPTPAPMMTSPGHWVSAPAPTVIFVWTREIPTP